MVEFFVNSVISSAAKKMKGRTDKHDFVMFNGPTGYGVLIGDIIMVFRFGKMKVTMDKFFSSPVGGKMSEYQFLVLESTF